MAMHALTEVGVAPGRAREAFWTTVRLGRRLGEQPGFRGLQVFRSETDADTLMVLSEWEAWEAAVSAQEVPPVAALLERAQALCTRWVSRRLDPLFHVQLPRRSTAAGMAQAVHVGSLSPAEGAARQKEFGLRAMTLPGTIGVLGGRCASDPSYHFCAVAFESDVALIDFVGSSTRREWARLGSSSWWRKDTRLELCRDGSPERQGEIEHRAECLGNLSVRVESSPDGGAVTLRLHGHMDEAAAERFGRVRDTLVAHGCRELTLDVSDLSSATRDGLQTLLDTARRVKDAGGQFTLADNQGRFNRILRVFRLNRTLAFGREKGSPRRRAVNLPINSPWKS
jgi:anti-anti-sigma factor